MQKPGSRTRSMPRDPRDAKASSNVYLWSEPFNPNILRPELWLDASDTSTITSAGSPSLVSQWNDKSGRGRNVSNLTVATQPTTGAATQNGLNLVSFSDKYLYASTASDWYFLHNGTTTYACYLVVRRGVAGQPHVMGTARWVGGTVGFMFVYYGEQVYNYVSSAVANPILDQRTLLTGRGTAFNVIGLINDPGNAIISERPLFRLNGWSRTKSNGGSGAPTTNNSYGTLTIGGAADGAGFTGEIGEILIWKEPTSAQCSAVENYLMSKWGISNS